MISISEEEYGRLNKELELLKQETINKSSKIFILEESVRDNKQEILDLSNELCDLVLGVKRAINGQNIGWIEGEYPDTFKEIAQFRKGIEDAEREVSEVRNSNDDYYTAQDWKNKAEKLAQLYGMLSLDLNEATGEIDTLVYENEKLDKINEDVEKERKRADDTIKGLELQISDMKSNMAKLRDNFDKDGKELFRLKKENGELKDKCDKLGTEDANHLRNTHIKECVNECDFYIAHLHNAPHIKIGDMDLTDREIEAVEYFKQRLLHMIKE